MKKIITLLALAFCLSGWAQISIITTIAGNGTAGYSGDGGQATNAELSAPTGIIVDSLGNVFFVEQGNNRVRKINTTGIITTIAGNGTSGHTGDGGQATVAELSKPTDLIFDKYGNLYVSDQNTHCVRKINTNGVISTFAGTGVLGYSGDGGQATAAELYNTDGLIFDKLGNLYIGDGGNYRVRMVNTNGIISTYAGNGISGNSGDGGQATAAELQGADCSYIDRFGNFFTSDQNNDNIRKINTLGIISTIAGTGTAGFSGDGGQATACMFYTPESITGDLSGNLYIADFYNNRVRKISTSGIITTVVGNGIASYSGDGGLASTAGLYYPIGITLDTQGNLYISDYENNRIRKVTNIAAAGIEQFANNNEQVNIYPNPSNGLFNLSISQFDNEKINSIEVYNTIGDCVHGQIAASANCQINLTNLNDGVYNISITTNEGVVNKRLVIVR